MRLAANLPAGAPAPCVGQGHAFVCTLLRSSDIPTSILQALKQHPQGRPGALTGFDPRPGDHKGRFSSTDKRCWCVFLSPCHGTPAAGPWQGPASLCAPRCWSSSLRHRPLTTRPASTRAPQQNGRCAVISPARGMAACAPVHHRRRMIIGSTGRQGEASHGTHTAALLWHACSCFAALSVHMRA